MFRGAAFCFVVAIFGGGEGMYMYIVLRVFLAVITISAGRYRRVRVKQWRHVRCQVSVYMAATLLVTTSVTC